MGAGITDTDRTPQGSQEVLTEPALALVAHLHRKFEPTRRALLAARAERHRRIAAGEQPTFLEESRGLREADWQVAATPADLLCRWCEITGPCDRKMMINALNSGAKVFMADLEDSLSPSWANIVGGQLNLQDAVRRTIELTTPEKRYQLNDPKDGPLATLLVRPRGWHLTEKHVLVDGEPVAGGVFDFALYMFHNAAETLARGSGPYFYLPKLESHREARLWNEIINEAQDFLGLARGTVRATVLIETILAAFEMEEILYELRDHAAGLNAGRWDYIFSAIKKFAFRDDLALPDRGQITMTVPFMRAYTELLVRTCHRRGAHAIGGMSAFIPSRRDAEVNRVALAHVREDKEREARDGFDGSWVAHPDLVPIPLEVFAAASAGQPHQKHRLRAEVNVRPEQMVDLRVPGGTLTEAGVRLNVSVGLQYLNSWLNGNGAAAIFNLMEDAATAEISRAQLWQWVHKGARLSADGTPVSAELYARVRDEELDKLGGRAAGKYALAAELLDQLVLADRFEEFLTLRAYDRLCAAPRPPTHAAPDPGRVAHRRRRAGRRGHGRGGGPLCPLRLLPGHLPDLFGARRRDGLAARAHRIDERSARGDARARTGAAPHRSVPRLFRLRNLLPLRGGLRRAAAAIPRAGRAAPGRQRPPPAPGAVAGAHVALAPAFFPAPGSGGAGFVAWSPAQLAAGAGAAARGASAAPRTSSGGARALAAPAGAGGGAARQRDVVPRLRAAGARARLVRGRTLRAGPQRRLDHRGARGGLLRGARAPRR